VIILEENKEPVIKGSLPIERKTPPPIVVKPAGSEEGQIKYRSLSDDREKHEKL
jgi:hypothetical protein